MSEDDIIAALQGVTDPEVGVNIVDLGLIYGTEINGDKVRIVMTMTTPACPMHSYLVQEVRAAILDRFEGIASVDVALVWDPPWSARMISAKGKRQLGWE